MDNQDVNLLSENGWTIESENPLNLKHVDGLTINDNIATLLLKFLKEEKIKKCSPRFRVKAHKNTDLLTVGELSDRLNEDLSRGVIDRDSVIFIFRGNQKYALNNFNFPTADALENLPCKQASLFFGNI